MGNQVFKNPKIPLIIECALELMRDHGDHGLTMRQVAAKAGMSLSNLQYYFKNKNALLKGMVDFYFGHCDGLLANHIRASQNIHPHEQIRQMIEFGLSHGETITEICKIFREFWAIATRNEEINAYLKTYYKNYADNLSQLLTPMAVHPGSALKAASLLMPYFEGYAVTAHGIPLEKGQILDMLTDIIITILETGPKD